MRGVSNFQDAAFNWALQSQNREVKSLAAGILLRWTQLDGEEQQFLANLSQVSGDPKIVGLSGELREIRSRLANAANSSKQEEETLSQLQDQLEKKELELRKVSRQYNTYLQTQQVSLEDLRLHLPPKSGILMIKEYGVVDFQKGYTGKRHFLAVLLREDKDEVEFFDLGEAGRIHAFSAFLGSSLRDLLQGIEEKETREEYLQFKFFLGTTPYFYDQVFALLDQNIADLKSLFLVPIKDDFSEKNSTFSPKQE